MAVLDGMTKQQVLDLAKIDPELESSLKQSPWSRGLREYLFSIRTPWIHSRVIDLIRDTVQKCNRFSANDNVGEKDLLCEARDGHKLRLRVFQPAKTPSTPHPAVVLYHGGGWTIGSPEDLTEVCRRLVEALDVVCVAPQYRLAPEHPFPTGINDAWDSLQWISRNPSAFGASLADGFILGGSSAGANFSAVLSHLARDESLPTALTGLYLAAPMLLPESVVPPEHRERYLSRTQPECRKDVVLSPQLQKLFHDSVHADESSHLFAPFNWPTGHADLPRTYLQVAGMDTLRDEALIYEQVLSGLGVETRVDLYPGLPHIFWAEFPALKASAKQRDDTVKGIVWLLRKKESM